MGVPDDAGQRHRFRTWFSSARSSVLEPELSRPVNDRSFDVALHIVFESKSAHDVYQDAPRHHAFVDENRDNWATVRVFDSEVQGGS